MKILRCLVQDSGLTAPAPTSTLRSPKVACALKLILIRTQSVSMSLKSQAQTNCLGKYSSTVVVFFKWKTTFGENSWLRDENDKYNAIHVWVDLHFIGRHRENNETRKDTGTIWTLHPFSGRQTLPRVTWDPLEGALERTLYAPKEALSSLLCSGNL